MKKVVLIGNPNTGKTTFFNAISNSNEHIGNWHGVTVECKEKLLKTERGEEFLLVDLPGTYSLCAYSIEEAVTRDYCLSNLDAQFLNICDGNNLERNLYLTLELLELGIKPILIVNMANELRKSGKKIDEKMLSKMLGIDVFFINAQDKREVKEFQKKLFQKTQKNVDLPYIKKFENIVDNILTNIKSAKNLSNFEKLKICELDDFVIQKAGFSAEQKDILEKEFTTQNTMQNLIESRYEFVDRVISSCVKSKKGNYYGYSNLDKVLLNKYLAFPIFLILMVLIFAITFGKVGSFLSNVIYAFFDDKIFGVLKSIIIAKTNNLFLQNFLCQAVFGTLSSLFSFLPQISLMFLGLYILEDTGYLSRLAFCFDDIFELVGLNGKSTFALLMGFGCGTTATLSARDMENKNSKIKTAILTPYISCTAKLPLYALICSAFFPKTKFLIVAFIYILGVVIALVVSYFLNKTVLPNREKNFMMELPPYRFPSAKKLSKKIIENVRDFVLRVGTILLGFSSVIWIFQNCNFKFQYGAEDSILMTISNWVAPLFSPLGFGNAGAVASLLCGFVAKEIIVSTIGIVNNVQNSKKINQIANSLLLPASIFVLTKQSALSFLVFATLYLPCISTVSIFIKELGKKWTLFACVLEFAISYVVSLFIYRVSLYFAVNGTTSGIISLGIFVVISFLLIFATKAIKQKKYCKFCPKCNFCDKK